MLKRYELKCNTYYKWARIQIQVFVEVDKNKM